MKDLNRLRRFGYVLLSWFFIFLAIYTIIPAGTGYILDKVLRNSPKTEFEKNFGLAKWIVKELRAGSSDYKMQVIVLMEVTNKNGIGFDQIGTSTQEVLGLIKKNAKNSALRSLKIFRSQDYGKELLREEILFDLKIAKLSPEDIGSSKEELSSEAEFEEKIEPKPRIAPKLEPFPDLDFRKNQKINI